MGGVGTKRPHQILRTHLQPTSNSGQIWGLPNPAYVSLSRIASDNSLFRKNLEGSHWKGNARTLCFITTNNAEQNVWFALFLPVQSQQADAGPKTAGLRPWDRAPTGRAEVPGRRIGSLKMTVHFSLRKATHRLETLTDTHTHTRTPASSETALGWSISRTDCWWSCVCDSRLKQRSYSDSDNDDGDGNEDGTDGRKHMTAIVPKRSGVCGFCADP